jgi:alpha-L-fucosidase 2
MTSTFSERQGAKTPRILIVFFFFASWRLGVPPAFADTNDLKLWYKQPAAKWEEALPVGSGRLGAMVFGGTGTERIQFNEDTLWSGKPHDYVRAGARDHLDEIRKLVFDGKIEDAGKLFRDTMISDPVRQKAYQPFGDLRFTFPGHEAATNYRRELDLASAIATTSYLVGDVTYTREVFASYPDNAIVVHIGADKPGKVSFALKMDSPHQQSTCKAAGDTLKLDGQVRDSVPPKDLGMKFQARLRPVVQGGSVNVSDDGIKIEGADSATLLLVAATDFVNFRDISANPGARCESYLSKLDGKDFDALRAAASAEHQKLFGRVTLDLGHTEAANLPTDERINRVRKAANPSGAGGKNAPIPDSIAGGLDADPALAALFFQFGRYMLITASRPGSQAANLQGVWNELLNPPWESKYTTNINVEMNYWPAEVTNLSECADPLFDMIDDLRVSGARTAKEMYGCRGWVLHHNTDLWRGTAPINNIDGMWPTGGAWLCYHLWEHYLFTGDKDFLAKRAYPAMKEASEFFLDFLVKDPRTGNLVTCPSFSPEQGTLCAGPAMDMQMIRALFDSTMAASHVLGDIDAEEMQQIAATRRQLVPDQVGKAGELREWQEDLGQKDRGHRHMSPLWGLYPGAQFTETMDPKIWAGVKTLLEQRGDGSTGWSYAWRIPLWARVGDGEFAYRQLKIMMGRKVLPNLFDLCGPFQADGNYGAAAGVAEMLVQSHRRTSDTSVVEIDLLPAIPKAWAKGSLTGLRARDGFEIDLTWVDGKITQATIHSALGKPCRVRWNGKSTDLELAAGKSQTIGGHAD